MKHAPSAKTAVDIRNKSRIMIIKQKLKKKRRKYIIYYRISQNVLIKCGKHNFKEIIDVFKKKKKQNVF